MDEVGVPKGGLNLGGGSAVGCNAGLGARGMAVGPDVDDRNEQKCWRRDEPYGCDGKCGLEARHGSSATSALRQEKLAILPVGGSRCSLSERWQMPRVPGDLQPPADQAWGEVCHVELRCRLPACCSSCSDLFPARGSSTGWWWVHNLPTEWRSCSEVQTFCLSNPNTGSRNPRRRRSSFLSPRPACTWMEESKGDEGVCLACLRSLHLNT